MSRATNMKNFILFVCLSLLIQCRPQADSTITEFPGKPEIPLSVKNDHAYLLDQIAKLTLLKDSTGGIAIKLHELMEHHFREEEDFVLPPLGHLQTIAEGKLPSGAKEIINLTEKLKAQSDHMLAEHQLIKAFMDELVQAAAVDNHPEVILLAEQVSKHASIEEEVFFPAAIVIGDYLKLKIAEQ